jgi:hypothetical protein
VAISRLLNPAWLLFEISSFMAPPRAASFIRCGAAVLAVTA